MMKNDNEETKQNDSKTQNVEVNFVKNLFTESVKMKDDLDEMMVDKYDLFLLLTKNEPNTINFETKFNEEKNPQPIIIKSETGFFIYGKKDAKWEVTTLDNDKKDIFEKLFVNEKVLEENDDNMVLVKKSNIDSEVFKQIQLQKGHAPDLDMDDALGKGFAAMGLFFNMLDHAAKKTGQDANNSNEEENKIECRIF